MSEPFVYVGT
jgi:hypothetical protein